MGTYTLGTGITLSAPFAVNGIAADPTTVTFYIRDPLDDLTTYVFGVDPEITNPSVGLYQLALVPTIPGHYNWRAEGTGAVIAACEGDFEILPSPTLTIETQPPEFGPCTAWIDEQDVAECCDSELSSDALLFDAVVVQASQMLFELSARRFAGSCQRTVRPCGDGVCGFQVLSRGHIVWPDGIDWGWTGRSWSWPSYGGCGCNPVSRIKLSGYPVTSIVSVKIDGQTVNPDTYRLVESELWRVRDPADPDTALMWPSCQILDLPDTEEGTFSVTYIHGADPPAIGKAAAAQLACQLYKSCTSGTDCALPPGTTRATRQGLTIETPATLSWFYSRGVSGWNTGLPLVDAFLSAYNPSAIQRRAVIWSASGPQYARPG